MGVTVPTCNQGNVQLRNVQYVPHIATCAPGISKSTLQFRSCTFTACNTDIGILLES
jgi:hypothetical protein